MIGIQNPTFTDKESEIHFLESRIQDCLEFVAWGDNVTSVDFTSRENRKDQKHFWNVIVLQEKSQSGVRKLNRKQER